MFGIKPASNIFAAASAPSGKSYRVRRNLSSQSPTAKLSSSGDDYFLNDAKEQNKGYEFELSSTSRKVIVKLIALSKQANFNLEDTSIVSSLDQLESYLLNDKLLDQEEFLVLIEHVCFLSNISTTTEVSQEPEREKFIVLANQLLLNLLHELQSKVEKEQKKNIKDKWKRVFAWGSSAFVLTAALFESVDGVASIFEGMASTNPIAFFTLITASTVVGMISFVAFEYTQYLEELGIDINPNLSQSRLSKISQISQCQHDLIKHIFETRAGAKTSKSAKYDVPFFLQLSYILNEKIGADHREFSQDIAPPESFLKRYLFSDYGKRILAGVTTLIVSAIEGCGGYFLGVSFASVLGFGVSSAFAFTCGAVGAIGFAMMMSVIIYPALIKLLNNFSKSREQVLASIIDTKSDIEDYQDQLTRLETMSKTSLWTKHGAEYQTQYQQNYLGHSKSSDTSDRENSQLQLGEPVEAESLKGDLLKGSVNLLNKVGNYRSAYFYTPNNTIGSKDPLANISALNLDTTALLN